MGTLAKRGIFNGRKVALTEVPHLQNTPTLDPLTRACFGRYGFARIAERIREGQPLASRDIESLLVKAPISVLLKLIELKGRPSKVRSPEPLLVLPLASWLETQGKEEALHKAKKLLLHFDSPSPRVVLDILSNSKMHTQCLEAASVLMKLRPDLVFVGPTVDELIAWALAIPSRDPLGLTRNPQFEEILAYIKNLGLHRLRPCSVLEVAPSVKAAGFPLSMLTNLADFTTPAELAREIFRIHELSVSQQIEVWVPGFESPQPAQRAGVERAIREHQLLRTLATGALALTRIPFYRASSRYFSLDALRMAARFGANDFGFGAVNAQSAKLLQIEPIETLQRALQEKAAEASHLNLTPEQ